jgi:hypothetical protein
MRCSTAYRMVCSWRQANVREIWWSEQWSR